MSNTKIYIKSKAFPFKFIIANVRLDWNIFDIACWFIKKVEEIDDSYFFCYRRDYKNLKNVLNENQKLRECILSFSNISKSASDYGADIYCYNKVGEVIVTLPSFEWWKYKNLMNDFEKINKWCNDYF